MGGMLSLRIACLRLLRDLENARPRERTQNQRQSLNTSLHTGSGYVRTSGRG